MRKSPSLETIEKIRQSNLGQKRSDAAKAKMRVAHLGKKLSPEHREKVKKTLRPIHKGQTYEEVFGLEIATRIKEKMRLAKLGKKMPWNSVPERVGEKSPRWIKDRSKIKISDRNHSDPQYKQWRKSVLIADNFKCKIVDKNCKGRLEAHHILTWNDHPELRYYLNNGITLCHAHHPRRRAEEKRLASTFQKIVDQRQYQT